jgi:short-subunit dehydrogenase
MDLKGKKIIVTGASSGIGKALTKRLLKAQADIVGISRNKEDIEKIFGSSVYAISCDVSKSENIDAMLKEAEEYFGEVDIFVSNAGFAYYGPIGPPDWEKNKNIFDTNVLAPIYTLQKLTQNREKPLVFMLTISALGKMVLPGFALYDATKFALDGFIRTYRMERPKNIKVIPVYPVATFTDFFNRAGNAPMPFPPNPVGYVAWCMEMGLKIGARSVYPSFVFMIRCLLSRVLPVDLGVQAIEKIRFKAWRKKYEK